MSNDSHDPQQPRHAASDDASGRPLRRARRDRDPSLRGSARVTPADANRLSRRSRDGEGESASARHAARLEEAARLQKLHEQEVRERLPDETDSDVQRRIQDLDERLTRLQHQLPTGGVQRAGAPFSAGRDAQRARRSAEAAERGERDSFDVPGRESVFGATEPESYETSSLPIVSGVQEAEIVEERAFPESAAPDQPMFPGPQELVAEVEDARDSSLAESVAFSTPAVDAYGDTPAEEDTPAPAGQPDPLQALMSYQAPAGRDDEEPSLVRAHLEKKDAAAREAAQATSSQEDSLPSWQEAAEMSGIFTPSNAPTNPQPSTPQASKSVPDGPPSAMPDVPASPAASVERSASAQQPGPSDSGPADHPVWTDRRSTRTPADSTSSGVDPSSVDPRYDTPQGTQTSGLGASPLTPDAHPEQVVPEPPAVSAFEPPVVPEHEPEAFVSPPDATFAESAGEPPSPGQSFHEMLDHFTGVSPAHGAPNVAHREQSPPHDSLDQVAESLNMPAPPAPSPVVSGDHGLGHVDTPESLSAITDDAASLVGKPPTGDHDVSEPRIVESHTPEPFRPDAQLPPSPAPEASEPLHHDAPGEDSGALGALPQFTVERTTERSGVPPVEDQTPTWAQPPATPPVDEYLMPAPETPRQAEAQTAPAALPVDAQSVAEPVAQPAPMPPPESVQGPATTVWPTVEAVERHTQPSPAFDEQPQPEFDEAEELQTQAYTMPPPTGAVPLGHGQQPVAHDHPNADNASDAQTPFEAPGFEPPLAQPVPPVHPDGTPEATPAQLSAELTGEHVSTGHDVPTSATQVWPTLPGGQQSAPPVAGVQTPPDAQPMSPSPFVPPTTEPAHPAPASPEVSEAAHYLGQSVTPAPIHEAQTPPAPSAFTPPPGFSPSPQQGGQSDHGPTSAMEPPLVDGVHPAQPAAEQLPPLGGAPGMTQPFAGEVPDASSSPGGHNPPHGAFAPPSAFPQPPATPHGAAGGQQGAGALETPPGHTPDFGSGSGSWTVASDMVPPSGDVSAPPVDPAATMPVSSVPPAEHGERLAPMSTGSSDAATWVTTGSHAAQSGDSARAEFPAEYVDEDGPKKGTSLVSWIAILIVITLGVAAATYMVVKAAADDTPATGTSEKVTGESFPASSVIGVAVTTNDGRQLLQCAVLGRSTSGPSVMSVPVRSLVNVPGAGFQPLADAPRVGENAVFDAVQGVLRVSFTSTVSMTENEFAAMVDRLGGVSVEIDERLTVAGQSIEPGDNVQLDGAKAAAVLHTDERRDGVSDSSIRFARMMKDVLHRVSGADAGAVPVFSGGHADAEGAVRQLAELSSTTTASTLVAPASDIGNGEVSVVRLDRSATLRLSREAFAGAFRAVDPDAVRVLLRNSGGVPGLTLSARDKLTDMPGVEVELGGNANRLGAETSMVSIPEDSAKYRRLGEEILSRLGLPASTLVVSHQESHDVDVMVLVGADYS